MLVRPDCEGTYSASRGEGNGAVADANIDFEAPSTMAWAICREEGGKVI